MAKNTKTTNVATFKADDKQLQQQMKELVSMVKSFEKSLDHVAKSTGKANKGVAKTETAIARLRGQMMKTTKATNTAAMSAERASLSFTKMGGSLLRATLIIGGAGTALYAVNRAFRASIGHALDFDRVMVKISKTTRISGGSLEALRDRIQEISGRLGLDRNEVGRVASIAGQLGISNREDLTAFTDVIVQLTQATNLTAENASLALARVLRLTGTDIRTGIREIGDILVHLGNNLSAREDEIASMSVRLAGIIGQFKEFGATAADVFVLAGAGAAVKAQEQSLATATQKSLRNILKIGLEGGRELQAFATLFGKSTEMMADDIRTNLLGTFFDFLELVQSYDPVTQNQLLTRFANLADERGQPQLLKAASLIGGEGGSRALVAQQQQQRDALAFETARRLRSDSGRFDVSVNETKNAFDDLTRTLLSGVLPGMSAFARWLDRTINDPDQRSIDFQEALKVRNSGTPLNQDLKKALDFLANPETGLTPGGNRLTPFEEELYIKAVRAGQRHMLGITEGATADKLNKIIIANTVPRTGIQTAGAARLGPYDAVISGATRSPELGPDLIDDFARAGRIKTLTAESVSDMKAVIKEIMSTIPVADAEDIAAASELEALVVQQEEADALKAAAEAIQEAGRMFDAATTRYISELAGMGVSAEGQAFETERRAIEGLFQQLQMELARPEGERGLSPGAIAQIEAEISARTANLTRTANQGPGLNFPVDPRAAAAGATSAREEAAAIQRRKEEELAELNTANSLRLIRAQYADERKLIKHQRAGASQEVVAYYERLFSIRREFLEAELTLEGDALKLRRAQLQREIESLKKPETTTEKTENEKLADRISGTVADAIANDGSIKDAWEGLMNELAAELLNEKILKPFKESLSDLITIALDYATGKIGAGTGGLGGVWDRGADWLGDILRGPSGPAGGPIPGLAMGGDVRRAGLAMVGERGPEILSLPKGARVTPLQGGGIVINQHWTIYSEDDVAMERTLQRNLPMISEYTKRDIENNSRNNSSLAQAFAR